MRRSLWTPIERKCLHLLQYEVHSKPSTLRIHAFMLRHALDQNVNLLTKLLTCYSSHHHWHARRLFDSSPHKGDTFLSNILIKAYVAASQYKESLNFYIDLRRNTSFKLDSYTFTALLKSCSSGLFLSEGLQMHSLVVKTGFWLDLYVSTSLVDMYSKCGILESAEKAFYEMPEKNLVSWTALFGGYVKSADMSSARKLFDTMPVKDLAAFNLMIDGYVKLGEMALARCLFDEIPEPNVITCTSMIYGYCRIGDVESAHLIFESMPHRNLYSWNVMISGCCQNNRPHEALRLFHDMQLRSLVEPDDVTVVSILPAIANLGALDLGNWVHQYARKKKFDRRTNVCTALIDMFAKCGAISEARDVFYGMAERELASWNALINGLAINGCGKKALELFLEMQSAGYKPNEVTLLGVLSACNHSGLLEEGKRWFRAMEEEFGLTTEIEHYGCMIDLLGRAGCLAEAENLINTMPYKANGIILSSFLFACGCFNDAERADRLIKKIAPEQWNDGNYIILRNLYATERRWSDVEEIKGSMRERGANKEVGCSVIEVDGEAREFVAGDKKHPEWQSIRSTLDSLFVHFEELAAIS